jgi:hypothetical protein
MTKTQWEILVALILLALAVAIGSILEMRNWMRAGRRKQ